MVRLSRRSHGTTVPISVTLVAAPAVNASTMAITSIVIPAGDTIIVVACNGNGANLLLAATDTAGNTYAMKSEAGGSSPAICIWSSSNTMGLLASDTINLTWGTATGAFKHVNVLRARGVGQADKSLTNTGGTAAWASAASGNLSTERELIVVGVSHVSTTATSIPEASWTELFDSTNNLKTYSKIVQTTGTQTATGTLSVATNWKAVLASYKSG